jgi:hypothetical protein
MKDNYMSWFCGVNGMCEMYAKFRSEYLEEEVTWELELMNIGTCGLL